MTAPTLQAQGATATGVTSGAPTITIPTHQAGDILVVSVIAWVPNTTGDAAEIPTPAGGWANMASQVKTADGLTACFWLRATGAGTTITLTRGASWDTGTDTCYNGRAYVIRGCASAGNPWDAVATSGPHTAADQSFPAVTVNGAERMVVIFGQSCDNAAFAMSSSGWTDGTEDDDAGGTDSAFQTIRKDNVSSSTSAAAATVSAPAQGIYSFFGVSFAPNPVLAVADASAGVSIDSPALVQANVLAVDDMAVACTSDNVALTQANVLVVADAAVAAEVDLIDTELPGTPFFTDAADDFTEVFNDLTTETEPFTHVAGQRLFLVVFHSSDVAITGVQWAGADDMGSPIASGVQGSGVRVKLYSITGATAGEHTAIITFDGDPNIAAAWLFAYDDIGDFEAATISTTQGNSNTVSGTVNDVEPTDRVIAVVGNSGDQVLSTLRSTAGVIRVVGVGVSGIGLLVMDRVGPGDVTLGGVFPGGSDNWLMLAVAFHGQSSTPLTVQDAAVDVTMDNVALTQANVLQIDDMAVGVVSEEPALVQASTIAVQDAAVATTIDNVALTQANVLAPDDATVAATADNVALTQANILALDDATVAATADNVALTQANVLAPDDATVAATVDNVALTQANILAPDDATVAVDVQPITLFEGSLLSVADATVAVTSDNLALTQANNLVVQDAAVAATEDNVALTQAHVLAPADAAVAVTAEAPTLSSGGALAPADMAAACTMEQPTLSIPTEVIAPADIQVAVSMDNVFLAPVGVPSGEVRTMELINNVTLSLSLEDA
jgi:hypothetical protein